MSIIRNRHNAKKPFVILDRATLWNDKLSLKALGLWARCISRPDNWRFCVKELIKSCQEGRDSIYGGIKELIEVRLCIRVQHRIPNGKNGNTPGPVEYIFLEVPASSEEAIEIEEDMKSEFKKSLSYPDFQEAGFEALKAAETEDPGTEDPGKRTLPSNYIYKEKKNNQSTKEVEREACGAFVKLSKEEHQKAKELCGDALESLIEEMNDYCAAHGKRYKDYLAAIRTWWKKRELQPVRKESVEQKRKLFSNEMKKNCRFPNDFEVLIDAVRFKGYGPTPDIYISFKEHGFEERVQNEFRKRGLLPPHSST